MREEFPFTLVAGHFVSVPVQINGRRTARFLFDTGIGVTTLATSLLAEIGAPASDRTFVGHRMSGQAVSVPLYQVDRIALGSHRQEGPVVGAFDLPPLPGMAEPVEGILSLRFFEEAPVTLDFLRGRLGCGRPGRDDGSYGPGSSVPVEVTEDGPALTMFLELGLPSKGRARVEVDTGSDSLILDERYLPRLGFPPDGSGLEARSGTDETGHDYTRYRGRISGPIFPVHAPQAVQRDPSVIFQKIIYDGLIGHDFFRSFVTTFDVGASRIHLAPRNGGATPR